MIFKFRKTLFCGGLLLTAVFVVAGCGGGEDSLTKAEFIKQSDAICSKNEEQKSEKFEAFVVKNKLGPENPITIAQQQKLVTTIMVPPIRKMTEEIGDLPSPEGQEEDADAIVAAAEEVVERLEDNPLPLVTPKSRPFADVVPLAKKFGFKRCYVYYL